MLTATAAAAAPPNYRLPVRQRETRAARKRLIDEVERYFAYQHAFERIEFLDAPDASMLELDDDKKSMLYACVPGAAAGAAAEQPRAKRSRVAVAGVGALPRFEVKHENDALVEAWKLAGEAYQHAHAKHRRAIEQLRKHERARAKLVDWQPAPGDAAEPLRDGESLLAAYARASGPRANAHEFTGRVERAAMRVCASTARYQATLRRTNAFRRLFYGLARVRELCRRPAVPVITARAADDSWVSVYRPLNYVRNA